MLHGDRLSAITDDLKFRRGTVQALPSESRKNVRHHGAWSMALRPDGGAGSSACWG